ncbi:MAG: DUF3147 family protein [Verrucomicrobiales bacterium]
MTLYLTKIFVSAGIILAVSELAKRNNTVASVVHSLPLTSLLALSWIFWETKDTRLIASHAHGTFWFVLPTLPMFLVLPALLRVGWGYWPALGVCLVGTFGLYALTMWVTKALGIQF